MSKCHDWSIVHLESFSRIISRFLANYFGICVLSLPVLFSLFSIWASELTARLTSNQETMKNLISNKPLLHLFEPQHTNKRFTSTWKQKNGIYSKWRKSKQNYTCDFFLTWKKNPHKFFEKKTGFSLESYRKERNPESNFPICWRFQKVPLILLWWHDFFFDMIFFLTWFNRFLDASKTERLAVKNLREMFEKDGFSTNYFEDNNPKEFLVPGSKFLYVYKKKVKILIIFCFFNKN